MSVPARLRLAGAAVAALLLLQTGLRSETAIAYRFTFPEPEHHWMAVEATFTELAQGPLELRMSRSSPGRYSLHDFAKNVYDVQATGPDGRPLTITKPDPYGWTIRDHGVTVSVRYKVFGDTVDGTYLGVDPTHAHLNMPASIMWARGLDDRTAQLTFVPPAGVPWQAATQLLPTRDPLQFTAPNLQYLMDSPTELGPLMIRSFSVDGHTFRFAAHHTGTSTELDGFVGDVRKIVAAERDVFGEFPTYEPGYYTFLADYLPWARGDGMEHRNSTVMTAPGAISSNRAMLLDTVAHEFFHNWNVERIRPGSLEPFDLERANMSGELWLAEGFTQYYGPLSLSRAGVADLRATRDAFSDLVTTVLGSPGRLVRSAEEMSQMAPFTDGGRPIDRTNWSNTVISYYPFGGAIALALDLSLRERFEGHVTLDDFMRAMWRVHGRPADSRPGYVAHPYTMADAEQRLAEVSGDEGFARRFFSRYIRGREVADYATLLAPAGFALQQRNPGQAWWGDMRLEARNGLRLGTPPVPTAPAYKAGLDIDDEIRMFDGAKVAFPEDVMAALRRHKPGDRVDVEYVDRSGTPRIVHVTLEDDPRLDLVAIESTGRTLTAAQIAFRAAWLGRKG